MTREDVETFLAGLKAEFGSRVTIYIDVFEADYNHSRTHEQAQEIADRLATVLGSSEQREVTAESPFPNGRLVHAISIGRIGGDRRATVYWHEVLTNDETAPAVNQ